MDGNEFLKLAVETVAEHLNMTIDLHPTAGGRPIQPEDIFVVWSVKVLNCNKAILSTNAVKGILFELTYNGEKDELYLDEYFKSINRKIKMYHPS